MFHNAHLKPPYTDPRRIEPTYRMVLEHHAPVVLLTARQRADAELVYGEHPNYFVIPNAAPSAAPEPSAQRDPRLVVMLARPHYVKRLDHAIRAFHSRPRPRPGCAPGNLRRRPREGEVRAAHRQAGRPRVGEAHGVDARSRCRPPTGGAVLADQPRRRLGLAITKASVEDARSSRTTYGTGRPR